MTVTFIDSKLNAILKKIEIGDRLTFEDGMILYQSTDLLGVGRLADSVRRQTHGNKAFYVVNRHLNYTNICMNQCRFCAYARKEGDAGGYTMSLEQAKEWVMSHPEGVVHQPGKLTDRHAVTDGQGISADEGPKSGRNEISLEDSSSDRIRPVEDPNLDTRLPAGFHAIRKGVDIRIVAASHILQINE